MNHRSPDRFFSQSVHTIKWQEGKLYDYRERKGDDGSTAVTETAFDGRIRYLGQHGRRRKVLGKHPLKSLQQKDPDAQIADTMYFQYSGFHLPDQVGDLVHPTAESLPLKLLNESGTLISAQPLTVGSDDLFAIEIESANPEHAAALKLDIEAVRRDLEFSKETDEDKEAIIQQLRDKQKLPETIRTRFFLDPKRNYAVVRWEHRYGVGDAIRTCTCEDFVKVDGRSLWLPRKVSLEFLEYFSRP